jgi:retron-type reverse transcriptase
MAQSQREGRMKRAGGLWDTLVSFENMHEAARRAALGKKKRPDVAAFLLNGETELVELRRELQSGEYRPGVYREFRVRDPKPRLISAAPFRDRVVHHALTQILEPVFESRFSRDSFACRAGMGTHRALDRAKWGAARFPYVLKWRMPAF